MAMGATDVGPQASALDLAMDNMDESKFKQYLQAVVETDDEEFQRLVMRICELEHCLVEARQEADVGQREATRLRGELVTMRARAVAAQVQALELTQQLASAEAAAANYRQELEDAKRLEEAASAAAASQRQSANPQDGTAAAATDTAAPTTAPPPAAAASAQFRKQPGDGDSLAGPEARMATAAAMASLPAATAGAGNSLAAEPAHGQSQPRGPSPALGQGPGPALDQGPAPGSDIDGDLQEPPDPALAREVDQLDLALGEAPTRVTQTLKQIQQAMEDAVDATDGASGRGIKKGMLWLPRVANLALTLWAGAGWHHWPGLGIMAQARAGTSAGPRADADATSPHMRVITQLWDSLAALLTSDGEPDWPTWVCTKELMFQWQCILQQQLGLNVDFSRLAQAADMPLPPGWGAPSVIHASGCVSPSPLQPHHQHLLGLPPPAASAPAPDIPRPGPGPSPGPGPGSGLGSGPGSNLGPGSGPGSGLGAGPGLGSSMSGGTFQGHLAQAEMGPAAPPAWVERARRCSGADAALGHASFAQRPRDYSCSICGQTLPPFMLALTLHHLEPGHADRILSPGQHVPGPSRPGPGGGVPTGRTPGPGSGPNASLGAGPGPAGAWANTGAGQAGGAQGPQQGMGPKAALALRANPRAVAGHRPPGGSCGFCDKDFRSPGAAALHLRSAAHTARLAALLRSAVFSEHTPAGRAYVAAAADVATVLGLTLEASAEAEGGPEQEAESAKAESARLRHVYGIMATAVFHDAAFDPSRAPVLVAVPTGEGALPANAAQRQRASRLTAGLLVFRVENVYSSPGGHPRLAPSPAPGWLPPGAVAAPPPLPPGWPAPNSLAPAGRYWGYPPAPASHPPWPAIPGPGSESADGGTDPGLGLGLVARLEPSAGPGPGPGPWPAPPWAGAGPAATALIPQWAVQHAMAAAIAAATAAVAALSNPAGTSLYAQAGSSLYGPAGGSAPPPGVVPPYMLPSPAPSAPNSSAGFDYTAAAHGAGPHAAPGQHQGPSLVTSTAGQGAGLAQGQYVASGPGQGPPSGPGWFSGQTQGPFSQLQGLRSGSPVLGAVAASAPEPQAAAEGTGFGDTWTSNGLGHPRVGMKRPRLGGPP